MSDHRFDTCSLCPKLCRHACPVASGSGREAAVPSVIASVLREYTLGHVSSVLAIEAATLCTDCGACRDACHLHIPLPEHLNAVRGSLFEEIPLAPLEPIEGTAAIVAIETDDRPLASVLARLLGVDVARWPTSDQFGCAGIESNGRHWESHGAAIREAAGAREMVTIDGGVARALSAAGVRFSWAWDRLAHPAEKETGSCATGGRRGAACCGGAGPLARHHPEDAADLARHFWQHAPQPALLDARCRNHLRRAGIAAQDWLDRVMEGDR